MTGMSLRVLTYNVRSLRDDVDAVLEVVTAARPDVVCFQELPRFWAWRSQRRRLAAECGLRLVAGRDVRAVAVGVAVRPGLPVESTDELFLAHTRGRHQRSVASAVLTVGGTRLLVASVHLGLDERERLAHVPSVLRAAGLAGVPAVVAGDVNDVPGSPTWERLAAGRVDAFAAAGVGAGATYSARDPRRRIDVVLADPALRVAAAAVLTSGAAARASDHLPLVVDLTVP
jgi:endonuclease/exonuclease/phosphatase family metal-dependent hydrolase